jgi:hypothetical protein
VRVEVALDFVDLANPELMWLPITISDRCLVRLGDAHTTVTAGEAQVISEAWNRIADEIVELRDRGAALIVATPDTAYRFPAGPHLYEVCEACNYDTHRCFFCGDDLGHAEADGVNQHHPCYVDDEVSA